MKIYNTQTRQKEEFEPLEPKRVRMYVCGPTVYNYFHLGNARPFITYDTLRRYLEYRGYDVLYVQNFTDIDDKMILKAQSESISVKQLADRYIEAYFEDADKLNIRRAVHHPLATETIPMIIRMIETLVDKDYAYEAQDGVYFNVARYEAYGKLSHQKLEDLEAGASQRMDEGTQKGSSADFALWKFKKDGEPSWESPWGEGRPGWHIECSAMIKEYLGDTIDIHGGGQDLVFPHHENEIAQSEAANGKPFVRYWMHNGFININHEKMSKSSGNFFTVRDLLEHYDPQVLRFFMLSSHYRMPINFSTELLQAAINGFQRIVTCLENLDFLADRGVERKEDVRSESLDCNLLQACEDAKKAFIQAMDDDLNTADAYAAIFDLVRVANTVSGKDDCGQETLRKTAATIRDLLSVLGIYPQNKEEQVPQKVLDLLQQRTEAKKAKDFAKADKIRDDVQAMGYHVEDTPQGPKVMKR